LGIDLFADADLRTVGPTTQIHRYPFEFLRAIAAAPGAPWMYTGSLENYPRLVGRLARLRPLLGNGPEVLARVRDPRWLASQLSGSEMSFPATRFPGEKIPSEAGWLVKPIRSAAGLSIRAAEPADLMKACIPRDTVWQRSLPGESMSAAFLAVRGEAKLLGVTEQWIGTPWETPQPFQYAGSLAPAVITAKQRDLLVNVATRLSMSANIQGLFGIDFIRHQNRLALIEVNPRYTASMEIIEANIGQSLVAAHCRSLNTSFEGLDNSNEDYLLAQDPWCGYPRGYTGGYRAKLIVYASEAGFAGNRLQSAIASLRDERILAADIPVAGTLIQAQSPLCTLLATGDMPPLVGGRLLSAAQRVKCTLDPLPP